MLVVSLRYKIYLSFTVSVLNRPVDVCFTSFVRKTKNTLEKRVATERNGKFLHNIKCLVDTVLDSVN